MKQKLSKPIWASFYIFPNSETFKRIYMLYATFLYNIKCLPSKMQEEFTSQKYLRIFDLFGPLVCIWNNFKIPKLSCASTSYMQPFYNKIKSVPSKMQEEFTSQESVTDGRTDGWTDGQDRRTDGGNNNIPELSFESAGITKLYYKTKLYLYFQIRTVLVLFIKQPINTKTRYTIYDENDIYENDMLL